MTPALPTVPAREIKKVILTSTATKLDTHAYTFSSDAIIPASFTGDDFTISSPFLVTTTLVKSSSAMPEAMLKRATYLFQPFSTPNQDIMALLMLVHHC